MTDGGAGPPKDVTASPSAAPSPTPRLKFAARFKARLGRWFPARTREPTTTSGFAADSRFDWLYLAAAFALGLGFAALWWWIVQAAPVQPGDDPSTWLATSYYFIGVPAPSGLSALAYPPAAFPFVGIAVWLGGGPLLGGRIFMATMIALLGPTAYLFGRAVVRQPALGLLFAGLLLAEPDFQQLYYFGGFPNMFSYLFFLLSLTYLLRWFRSSRPYQLFVFWAALALCVLSHSLTGAFLGGTAALVVLALLVMGRVPRTFVASRAGLAGLAVLVGGLGAYYGGTELLGINHPSYLTSTSLGATKAQLMPNVLRPFYLSTVAGAVTHTTVTISAPAALEFMGGFAAIVLLLFLALAWKRPAWVTISWLILAATFLTVFAASVAGYELNLPVDYRRFPYFLYGPVILSGLLIVDSLLVRWMAAPSASARLPAPAVAGRKPRRAPLPWRRWVEPVLFAVGVAIVLVAAQQYTLPSGQGYEAYYTEYGHDQNFLNLLAGLQATGFPGNILSATPLDGHWPSTLTSRTTYVPSALGGNSYSATQIAQGETTDLVLGSRLSVTNGLVAAGIAGVEPGVFNASPIIGGFTQNLYQSLLQFPTASFEVGATNGKVAYFVPTGTAAPPVTEIDNGNGYAMTFNTTGATMTQTVVAVPGEPIVNVTFSATRLGTTNLSFLLARVAPLPGVQPTITNSTVPGQFYWNASSAYGNFSLTTTAVPAAALSKVLPFNNSTGSLGSATFRENASSPTAGAATISFSVQVEDPTATNVVPTLGPWISADQSFHTWNIRFLLLYNSGAAARFSPYYYAQEYGAAVVDAGAPYTIMILPSPLNGPSYLLAGS